MYPFHWFLLKTWHLRQLLPRLYSLMKSALTRELTLYKEWVIWTQCCRNCDLTCCCKHDDYLDRQFDLV